LLSVPHAGPLTRTLNFFKSNVIQKGCTRNLCRPRRSSEKDARALKCQCNVSIH
jgi:hypothetical protein